MRNILFKTLLAINFIAIVFTSNAFAEGRAIYDPRTNTHILKYHYKCYSYSGNVETFLLTPAESHRMGQQDYDTCKRIDVSQAAKKPRRILPPGKFQYKCYSYSGNVDIFMLTPAESYRMGQQDYDTCKRL